jgi:hypothetical protein
MSGDTESNKKGSNPVVGYVEGGKAAWEPIFMMFLISVKHLLILIGGIVLLVVVEIRLGRNSK